MGIKRTLRLIGLFDLLGSITIPGPFWHLPTFIALSAFLQLFSETIYLIALPSQSSLHGLELLF
jgi:hypothetical protein